MNLNLGPGYDATAAASGLMTPVIYQQGALRKISDTGSLLKLANVFSPLDAQNVIKVSNTRIANVYQSLAKGTVPLKNQSANTTGQSLFVENTVIGSKTDAEGNTIYLPMVARIELKLPNDPAITSSDIQVLVASTTSLFTGIDGESRVDQMMRGVLFRD